MKAWEWRVENGYPFKKYLANAVRTIPCPRNSTQAIPRRHQVSSNWTGIAVTPPLPAHIYIYIFGSQRWVTSPDNKPLSDFRLLYWVVGQALQSVGVELQGPGAQARKFQPPPSALHSSDVLPSARPRFSSCPTQTGEVTRTMLAASLGRSRQEWLERHGSSERQRIIQRQQIIHSTVWWAGLGLHEPHSGGGNSFYAHNRTPCSIVP